MVFLFVSFYSYLYRGKDLPNLDKLLAEIKATKSDEMGAARPAGTGRAGGSSSSSSKDISSRAGATSERRPAYIPPYASSAAPVEQPSSRPPYAGSMPPYAAAASSGSYPPYAGSQGGAPPPSSLPPYAGAAGSQGNYPPYAAPPSSGRSSRFGPPQHGYDNRGYYPPPPPQQQQPPYHAPPSAPSTSGFVHPARMGLVDHPSSQPSSRQSRWGH